MSQDRLSQASIGAGRDEPTLGGAGSDALPPAGTNGPSGPPPQAPANPPPPSPPPSPPRRRWLRIMAWAIGVLLAALVLGTAMIYGALTTQRGTALVWQGATKLLGGRLSGRNLGGALSDGVALRDVVWRDGGTEIRIDRIDGAWRLTRAPWRFAVDHLRVGTVDVRLAPSQSKDASPLKLPESLTLPLQLDLRDVTIAKLRLHNGTEVTELRRIALAASSDGRHHRLTLRSVETPWGDANAALALDGVRPFPLTADAAFRGADKKQNVVVAATAAGTLAAPRLDVNASGLNLSGRAHIEATPFDAVPFTLAAIAADHVNPRAVAPGAPEADLTIRAQLRPVSRAEALAEAARLASAASATAAADAASAARAASRTDAASAAVTTAASVDQASRPRPTETPRPRRSQSTETVVTTPAPSSPRRVLDLAEALSKDPSAHPLETASAASAVRVEPRPRAPAVTSARPRPSRAAPTLASAASASAASADGASDALPASTPDEYVASVTAASAASAARNIARQVERGASATSAATKVPGSGAGQQALTVAGTLSIVNGRPGRLDENRLPLLDARAQLRLDAREQRLDALVIRLLGGATVTGEGRINGGKGGIDLTVQALDLHALHPMLRRSRLGGPIAVRLGDAGQTVRARLDDPGARLGLQADVALRADATAIDRFRLSAGAGYVEVAGLLRRDAQSSYALKTTLKDFNPLAFTSDAGRRAPPAGKGRGKGNAKGAAATAPATGGQRIAAGEIDARVTGTIDAAGAFAPTLTSKVTFALRDSVYDGLPMTGAGTLNVAGRRLLPSDARLSVAGNDVVLRGSFGAPSDRLHFAVDARQLERLGFGLAGALTANGDVTGTFEKPNVSATYAADALVFGGDRVDHASGRAELRNGPNGALNATVEARGVRVPNVVLTTLDARVTGTRANHALEANAVGTYTGHPINARLAGRGGLLEGPGGTGWRGTVTTLSNQGTVDVALNAPMQISVRGQQVTVGATRLTAEGATLTLDNLSYAPGRIVSAGRVRDVDVNRMLEVQRTLTGERPAVDTSLVLDGDWNFTLAPSASGFVEIRRQRGDVRVSTGASSGALGLEQLLARLDFPGGSAANLRLDARAARLGTVEARLRTQLSSADGVLGVAPEAPLAGTINADLPSLRTTGGLLGPTYLLDGALRLRLTVAGQVRKPRVSGQLSGTNLAATLVDSGVQLKHGVVDIGITENLVELRRVEFHGGDGVIRATGRIQLDGENPDLTAKIVSDKLELFGAPDRQLSLSGQATIANARDGQGIDIDGRFVVDHALFDLPKSSAPRLGDDVVVIRSDSRRPPPPLASSKPAAERPVGRFAPRSNIVVDLGRDFRFRGAGADLLLAGALTVKSAPAVPLAANGEVRVVEGSTYEAFGRKLAIENGYFVFNGPIDNPSINILAMRRNQEVEAGVRVRGTVRSPEAVLVSEPNVPDNEKLSWLLFGHGTESTTLGQDNTASAALALLGSVGGKRIARSVGLDEFSLGPSESGLTDPQVVSIAKALNEHFVLGYEQGLTTAATLFKVTWLLSRRWSVAAQTGAINGVALYYTRRFD
ncbi:translocation/assembly module TamB domain-containing protein [Chitinasiproducens palmae]|nr:translocation/assembly module TamB domain-containing protein [Chitinasiproducens palmae]